MKVLFLDFDGPLFPDRYIKYDPDQRKPYPGYAEMPEVVDYWKMDPMSVNMLNFLHDLHPFTTVVSSSWKRFCDKESTEDLFAVNGLNLKLFDHPEYWSTPDWKSSGNARFSDMYYSSGDKRAKEITMWLEMNEEVKADYMILDDPMSGSSLDDTNHELDKSRIILVNPDVGIGTHDYQKMCEIVYGWAGIKYTRPLW